MKESELAYLECGDMVQCTNHPKVKGKAVTMFEGDSVNEKDTVCGCKIKDFEIVQNVQRIRNR